MTREETKSILSVLRAGYPNFYKDLNKADADQIIDLWATMFVDEPVKVVIEAVKTLMVTAKFPPTIADVKEKIYLVTHPQAMTEAEAWNIVKKAIGYYNAQEHFEALPPILQKLVGSPNQLREWGMMDMDEVNTIVASNFMRSYKARVQHEKETAMLPESTRAMIQGLSAKLSITDGKGES